MGAAKSLNRILIVCPASLRRNWLAEWQRWHVGPVKPVIVTDTWWPGLTAQTLAPAGPTAAILSYEGVRKHKKHIDAITWDLLILDEVHLVKDPKAKRTRAVFGFGNPTHQAHVKPIQAKRRLALSGTPIVNRPEELWPLVHALDREGLGRNQSDYRQRYVLPPLIPTNLTYPQGIKYLQQVTAQRMTELHNRLRSSIMIRRLKADVLKELPAKRRQIILVEAEGAAAALAAERAVIEEKAKELAALNHEKAVEKLRMWRGAAMTEISRIRHETALAKLPAVIEHLFELLDEVPKAVCWAHHHDCIDQIFGCMPKGIAKFDGRMNDAEKAEAVRRFQEDPACRVFVGSIMAGGLGITLTAASVELFAELSWTPASMSQAEDRCHRIGQKDSVLIRHLVIDGSIDQRMSRILVDKQALMDAVLDGQVPEAMRESVLDQVLAER